MMIQQWYRIYSVVPSAERIPVPIINSEVLKKLTSGQEPPEHVLVSDALQFPQCSGFSGIVQVLRTPCLADNETPFILILENISMSFGRLRSHGPA